MHEMSLVQGVLDAIKPVALENGADRVTCVTLSIGEMTQVVDEAMQFAWDALTEDDPMFAGAELVMEFVKTKSLCMDCGKEFEHDRFHMKCPDCGSRSTVVTAGKELHIASIEIEEDDEED